MHDSVPSSSYSSVCNVLCQCSILLIPTYRVYRLYDIHFYVALMKLTVVSINTEGNTIFSYYNMFLYVALIVVGNLQYKLGRLSIVTI